MLLAAPDEIQKLRAMGVQSYAQDAKAAGDGVQTGLVCVVTWCGGEEKWVCARCGFRLILGCDVLSTYSIPANIYAAKIEVI